MVVRGGHKGLPGLPGPCITPNIFTNSNNFSINMYLRNIFFIINVRKYVIRPPRNTNPASAADGGVILQTSVTEPFGLIFRTEMEFGRLLSELKSGKILGPQPNTFHSGLFLSV